MKKSTLYSSLAAASAALVVLTGCTGGGGGGGDGGEVGSDAMTSHGPITIWYSNNKQEVAWGEAMVKAWNADHPDEKITGQEIPAGKSSEEVITAGITAGTTPCLIFNTAPFAVGQFRRMGGLVDLSKFKGANNYIQERSGEAAEQFKAPDGDYYQMPWKSNPVMIFYNKDMFAAAGLDPANPKLSTYADFLATAKTLTSSGAAPYAIYPSPTSEFYQIDFDFVPLFAAETGGKQILENGEAVFDNQAGVDVATFWRQIYADGLAGKEQLQGDPFASGRAAMAIVGPWAIAAYQDKVNWGSVPVPTKNGTSPDETWTFSDAKNIGMYSSCDNQGTAWDVLKFATSKEQDGKFLNETGQMPYRENLPSVYPDYFESHPAYEEFGDQASRTVDVPSRTQTIKILQTLRDAYTKAVIAGKGDVESALSDAAERVEQIIGEQ